LNQNEADVCPQPSAGFFEPEALHDGRVPVPSRTPRPCVRKMRTRLLFGLVAAYLQTLRARASRDALAEQAKLAADQYPEVEEMWPCVARR
jgi:hypothetical protein